MTLPETRVVCAEPDEVSTEIRLIPHDASFFVHIDIASIYDSTLGYSIRHTKSVELKDYLNQITRYLGSTPDNIKTVTLVLPKGKDASDLQKSLVAIRFRKEYDRETLTSRLKEEASKAKHAVKESDGLIRVKSTRNGHHITVYDVRDSRRLIVLNGLPESYLTPSNHRNNGIYATALMKANIAAIVLGLNFTNLPDEIRGDNLPAEFRPFLPIFKAESLTAVGLITKGKVDLSVRVQTKNKAEAAEVEKSLAAVQTFAAVFIPQVKEKLDKNLSESSGRSKLLNELANAIARATFSVKDGQASARLSISTDLQVDRLLEMMLGGGASARMQSSNNLKQLALAMHNYESTYGFLPPAATLDKKGKKLLSWRVALLPYLEQVDLYKKFNLDEPWNSEHNIRILQDNPMPKVFAILGSKNDIEKKTHYQVFVGKGAMFETVSGTKISDIQDGTSNTILVGTATNPVEWTRPDDIEFDPISDVKNLLMANGKVILMAFGDGSVRAVTKAVDEKTLKSLITRSGGEVIDSDFE